jgi:hypothetical protein
VSKIYFGGGWQEGLAHAYSPRRKKPYQAASAKAQLSWRNPRRYLTLPATLKIILKRLRTISKVAYVIIALTTKVFNTKNGSDASEPFVYAVFPA